MDTAFCRRIAGLVAGQSYTAALSALDSLIAVTPDDPLPNFIRATVLYSRAVDFEDELDDEALTAACDRTEQLCNWFVEKGDHSAEFRFYLGSVWVYRSLIPARDGNRLKAIRYLSLIHI